MTADFIVFTFLLQVVIGVGGKRRNVSPAVKRLIPAAVIADQARPHHMKSANMHLWDALHVRRGSTDSLHAACRQCADDCDNLLSCPSKLTLQSHKSSCQQTFPFGVLSVVIYFIHHIDYAVSIT